MKKKNLFRITVKVEPAVRRFLTNHYPEKDGALDLTGSRHYFLVSNMLQRNSVQMPTKVPDRYNSFVPVTLWITSWDFYHLGWMTPPFQQYCFSRLLMAELMETACYRVAMVSIATGVSRRAAMRAVLDEELYEDNELSEDRLRKYYLRKYTKKEAELRRFVEEIQPQ